VQKSERYPTYAFHASTVVPKVNKDFVRNLVLFNENKRCNPKGQEKDSFIYLSRLKVKIEGKSLWFAFFKLKKNEVRKGRVFLFLKKKIKKLLYTYVISMITV